MVSSQQLLSNDHLTPRANTNDVLLSNHEMGIIFNGKGWAGPLWTMLLGFILLIVLKICGNWIGKKIESCFPSFAIGDIELDEDIDSYWASLDDEDRKWSQREEQNSRSELNMKLLTEE